MDQKIQNKIVQMKEGQIVNESEQLASLYFLPRYFQAYPYG